MTPERWRQVTEVFHAALARGSSTRASYLDQACAADLSLREEVDAMLAAHAISGDVPLTPPRFASGARIGPYRVTQLIGSGGMGEVYRALDTRLDRTVALKVLRTSVATDPELKERFEREAKTLAALSHPHICPVFDVGSQDGIDFLVMEYLQGEPLAQRLTKGSVPLDQTLRIGIQIAEALAAAHRAGIVHRDLKPGNVMLTKSGPHYSISDWRSSRLLH